MSRAVWGKTINHLEQCSDLFYPFAFVMFFFFFLIKHIHDQIVCTENCWTAQKLRFGQKPESHCWKQKHSAKQRKGIPLPLCLFKTYLASCPHFSNPRQSEPVYLKPEIEDKRLYVSWSRQCQNMLHKEWAKMLKICKQRPQHSNTYNIKPPCLRKEKGLQTKNKTASGIVTYNYTHHIMRKKETYKVVVLFIITS